MSHSSTGSPAAHQCGYIERVHTSLERATSFYEEQAFQKDKEDQSEVTVKLEEAKKELPAQTLEDPTEAHRRHILENDQRAQDRVRAIEVETQRRARADAESKAKNDQKAKDSRSLIAKSKCKPKVKREVDDAKTEKQRELYANLMSSPELIPTTDLEQLPLRLLSSQLSKAISALSQFEVYMRWLEAQRTAAPNNRNGDWNSSIQNVIKALKRRGLDYVTIESYLQTWLSDNQENLRSKTAKFVAGMLPRNRPVATLDDLGIHWRDILKQEESDIAGTLKRPLLPKTKTDTLCDSPPDSSHRHERSKDGHEENGTALEKKLTRVTIHTTDAHVYMKCNTPGHYLLNCPTNEHSSDYVPPRESYECQFCHRRGIHCLEFCCKDANPERTQDTGNHTAHSRRRSSPQRKRDYGELAYSPSLSENFRKNKSNPNMIELHKREIVDGSPGPVRKKLRFDFEGTLGQVQQPVLTECEENPEKTGNHLVKKPFKDVNALDHAHVCSRRANALDMWEVSDIRRARQELRGEEVPLVPLEKDVEKFLVIKVKYGEAGWDEALNDLILENMPPGCVTGGKA